MLEAIIEELGSWIERNLVGWQGFWLSILFSLILMVLYKWEKRHLFRRIEAGYALIGAIGFFLGGMNIVAYLIRFSFRPNFESFIHDNVDYIGIFGIGLTLFAAVDLFVATRIDINEAASLMRTALGGAEGRINWTLTDLLRQVKRSRPARKSLLIKWLRR